MGLNQKTDQEIEDEAAKVASGTFLGNLALLAIPNAFENSQIFGKLNKGKRQTGTITDVIDVGDNFMASATRRTPRAWVRPGSTLSQKVAKTLDFTKTGRLGFYGPKALRAFAFEGLMEENGQLAIQRLNESGDSALSFFPKALTQIYDAFRGADQEASEAIGLGALIGGLGVGMGSKFARERRNVLDLYTDAAPVVEKINTAAERWLSLNGYFETETKDGVTNIVFENGMPKLNQEAIKAKAANITAFSNLAEEIENMTDPDLQSFMGRELFKEYVKTNIESGTFEKVLHRLENFGEINPEEVKALGFDPEEVINNPDDLLNYAREVEQMYLQSKGIVVDNFPEGTPELMREVLAKGIQDFVFNRRVQNRNLVEYRGKLISRQAGLQSQYRDVDNASISDVYAEEYNFLTARIQALQDTNENYPSAFNTEKIAELEQKRSELSDTGVEDLTQSEDGYFINDSQYQLPEYKEYLATLAHQAEIQNAIDHNDYSIGRILNPDTRWEELNGIEDRSVTNLQEAGLIQPEEQLQEDIIETPPVVEVTPEIFSEFVESGVVPANVLDSIAQKIATGQETTEQERIIYAQRPEDIESRLQQIQENEGITEGTNEGITQVGEVIVSEEDPSDAPPPDNNSSGVQDYKGRVAFLTPLKTIVGGVKTVEGQEVLDVTPYKEWVQNFLSNFIMNFAGPGGQYRLFLMKDRMEWDYNKSPNYNGKLGGVIVVTDQEGNPVTFDENYNPSPTGQVISYSMDTRYTARDFDRKIATASQKGMLINGQYVKLSHPSNVRKAYKYLNDLLVGRRNEVVNNDTQQEVILTRVEKNVEVPTGEYRSANIVFGENPTMRIVNGSVLMSVEGQEFLVEPKKLNSLPGISDIYGYKYSSPEQAQRALEFLQSILPQDRKYFSNFTVNPDNTLSIMYSQRVLTPESFRSLVTGRALRVQMEVQDVDLNSSFNQVSVVNGELVENQTTYYEFLKNKFDSNIIGTRKTDGTVSYLPMSAYFTFEFADTYNQPIPESFGDYEAVETPSAPRRRKPRKVTPATPKVEAKTEEQTIVPEETAPERVQTAKGTVVTPNIVVEDSPSPEQQEKENEVSQEQAEEQTPKVTSPAVPRQKPVGKPGRGAAYHQLRVSAEGGMSTFKVYADRSIAKEDMLKDTELREKTRRLLQKQIAEGGAIDYLDVRGMTVEEIMALPEETILPELSETDLNQIIQSLQDEGDLQIECD